MRLLLVALGAFALCAAYAWRGYFSSDFWEHAAVVRELAVRPLAPHHPLLAIDATHAYFSPYHLAVALGARATGASPIAALAAAGLVNVVLLILAFRRFLVRLLPAGEQAAPYALLFVFFLWGKDAWMWSGFLHIGFLGYAAPYPSTLAAAAMFLAFSLLLDALDRARPRAFIGVGALVWLCTLTHPPTALVLFAGVLALFVGRVNDRVMANGLLLLAAVVAGVTVAMAWPYFPVVKLFGAQPAEFHSWSEVFYEGVPGQVWPAIERSRSWCGVSAKTAATRWFCSSCFWRSSSAIGGITGKFGLGRVIAYMALLVQVALGAAAAAWESRQPVRRGWLAPAGALMVSLGLFAYDRPPLPAF